MMIDPPLPASIIAGTAARMVRHVPFKLTSMTVSHCSSDISNIRPQLSTPALATTMSSRPNCFDTVGHHLLQRGQVADVDLAGQHLAAGGLHRLNRLRQVLGGRQRIGDGLRDRARRCRSR